MTHGSLFSGIGGFDLAAQWMGWENIFHCEWNPFGQKILHHYWPDAIQYTDITKTDFTPHANTIDILTGGFPCQPYSSAGQRKGKDDERHLWPEMLRAIREIAPRFVVGENVRGLTNWNGGLVFDEVCTDLENLGYQVAPFIIPASAVNAPHQRERVWFVAYSNRIRLHERGQTTNIFGKEKKTSGKGSESSIHPQANCSRYFVSTNWQGFPTQSPIRHGDDGLPTELDGITLPKWRNESIKAYGNAIVPQVVYQIFKAIEQYESKG